MFIHLAFECLIYHSGFVCWLYGRVGLSTKCVTGLKLLFYGFLLSNFQMLTSFIYAL